MTSIGVVEAETQSARPYGLVGLVLSSLLICVLAVILCLLFVLLAMGAFGLAWGWHPMLVRLNGLGETLQSDRNAVLRANVVVGIVLYAALSIAVLVAARIRGGRRWRDLVAWRPWHPFRAAWLFWLVAILSVVYSLGVGALISRYYPPSKEWVLIPSGPTWVALFVVLAVAMAPLTEELVFRGWLYTALRAKIGVVAGILGTSILFALSHWEKSHLYALAVFPIGVALGFFRERTKSLLATMTFHAVYNGGALLALALGF